MSSTKLEVCTSRHFDCADRLMRLLTGCARIWGGLYTKADLFQVAPVVRFGGRTAICNASLHTQAAWDHFEILELKTSMRQRQDPEFASFLDGDDHQHDSVDLSALQHRNSVQDLVNFVFPPEIVTEPGK
ncbi:hypothetical protein B0H16DRAFT_1644141, partial [Mycena metata]